MQSPRSESLTQRDTSSRVCLAKTAGHESHEAEAEPRLAEVLTFQRFHHQGCKLSSIVHVLAEAVTRLQSLQNGREGDTPPNEGMFDASVSTARRYSVRGKGGTSFASSPASLSSGISSHDRQGNCSVNNAALSSHRSRRNS